MPLQWLTKLAGCGQQDNTYSFASFPPTHPLPWLGSLVFEVLRLSSGFAGLVWSWRFFFLSFCVFVFLVFTCLVCIRLVRWSSMTRKGSNNNNNTPKGGKKENISSKPGKLHCTATLSSSQSILSEDNRTHVVGIPNTPHFRKTKPIYQQLQTMEALFFIGYSTLFLPILGEPLPKVCLWSGLWNVLFTEFLFLFLFGGKHREGNFRGKATWQQRLSALTKTGTNNPLTSFFLCSNTAILKTKTNNNDNNKALG